jgi:predicted permease
VNNLRDSDSNSNAKSDEVPRGLLVSFIAILASFIVGGFVHKVLDATGQLKGGDTFFSSVMLFGCVPLLIDAGILVIGQRRALRSTSWATILVLGLSLIVLSYGYFQYYAE